MNYRRALKKLIQKTKAYKKIMFGQNNKVKSEEERARKTQTLISTEKRRYSYSSADFTIIEDIDMFREEFMEDQYYEPVGNYYNEECFDFHYESEDDYEIIEYKSVR